MERRNSESTRNSRFKIQDYSRYSRSVLYSRYLRIPIFQSGKQVSQDEEEVGRALRQPSHIPREPERAVGDEDDRLPALFRQPKLLGALNAVEHLEFVGVFRQTHGGGRFRKASDEGRIVSGQGNPDVDALELGREQLLGKLEEVLVHVPFLRESDGRRLLVSPLHQPDGRIERKQRLQVLLGAIEVRLHAEADVRAGGARAAVKVQRRVHVPAGFHVDPDHTLAARVFDDLAEIGVAEPRAKVEAELGRLDGNFGAKIHHPDAVQYVEVVPGDGVRLRRIGDVLAQVGENGANAGVLKRTSSGKGFVDCFAGHEARNRPLHETAAGRLRAQPATLRARQKQAPHKGHGRLQDRGPDSKGTRAIG